MRYLSIHCGTAARFVLLALLAASCIMLLAFGVALALLGGGRSRAGATSVRTAIDHHLVKELGQVCTMTYCPKPPLLYFGGEVQEKPALYVTFWGKNWETKGAVLRNQIIKMYNDYSGSEYQNILTQYFDSSGHRIGTTLKLAIYDDYRVEAIKFSSKAEYETEVKEAIAANKWPKERNGQYILIPAPGSAYKELPKKDQSCGFHAVTEGVSYSVVAFVGDEPLVGSKGCNPNGDLNAATMATGSHEYFESATDPFFTTLEAWATPDNEYEISDICESGLDRLPDGSWVVGQWDNYKNECALADANPAYVYTITGPAAEVTESSATLQAKVGSENMETKFWFDYGTSPSALNSKTAEQAVAASWEIKPIKQLITSLTPKTFYYYVVVGENKKGLAKGRQQKFLTL